MHHKWQRIHCDRCLEELMAEELAEVSPRRGRVCTHGAAGGEMQEVIGRVDWPGREMRLSAQPLRSPQPVGRG